MERKKKEADDTRKYFINWAFCKRLMSVVKVSSVGEEKKSLLLDSLIKVTCVVFRGLRRRWLMMVLGSRRRPIIERNTFVNFQIKVTRNLVL